jgi:PhnB protein
MKRRESRPFGAVGASAQETAMKMNQPVTPYLTVKGAADAIAFYQKAFGATEEMRMPAQDGKRVMHAHLNINGGALFLCDEFPEHGDYVPAPTNGKSPVAVALAFTKPADVDATYKKAVAAGAKGMLEPGDQFWGARFAMLTDPFGHRWMLDAPLGKK